jgi:hypothetical protein
MRPILAARLAVLPLSLLVVASPAHAQTCPDAAALTNGVAPILAAVRYLADDALEGRAAGSAGEQCAGDYVAGRFQQIGLKPGGENDTFFQTVKIESVLNPHAPPGTGRNVIGILEGADPLLRHEYIIIGAHYDHLGRGGSGSLDPNSREIHNGADDNASGVAALIEAAAQLAGGDRPRRSIAFVAFTGEELGLLGSAHFVNSGRIPTAATRAMLNMDMVGRLGQRPLIVYGIGTAAEWKELVPAAARAEGLELALQNDGFGPSDHTSFYMRDIPVLHFFSNVHGDYHKPTDDWDRIDAAGVGKVASLVARVARVAADREPPLTLVRGAGTPPGSGQPQPGYGAYLGSIPDFTPVERGVKLGGVTPGSPADRAGLRAGDVLVGLGEHDVKDLQGLTDALRAHRPGETVKIRYLREGETREVSVQLGQRSR